MVKILLKTFEKEVDEQNLISIKETCKKIFANSNIEYKLDMESDVVGGSKRQSGTIEYYVYLCVEDEKEEEAIKLIDEWFADKDEVIVEPEIEERIIFEEELMVDEEESIDIKEKKGIKWLYASIPFAMLIVGILMLILTIIRKNFFMTALVLLWVIYLLLLIKNKD